jgi:hypothetical protein
VVKELEEDAVRDIVLVEKAVTVGERLIVLDIVGEKEVGVERVVGVVGVEGRSPSS